MNMISMEECELLGDSKYRAYTSQVEKALKNFEYTSEWADLISALTRLNKVLSTHMRYSTIPKKVTVGKRLAQCLHPALPGGVHLKAIETYDIIFKCIGRQRLAADLFTYSAGLFPLLGYAAMNVKPALLSIYETHFLLLGKQIKPALTGLLLGLLPGLEEGSDYYDRTFTLLCRFCEEADPNFFYTSLWECILTSPEVRQSAIGFVLANFNKKRSMEDQLHFIGNNIELLVQGLCASIEDSSVLVQRGALELLLLGFPLHNSQLTKSDLIKVLTSAIKVVLRRDMSLNRRLYAWLLGTDSSGGSVAVTSSDKAGKPRVERQDSITSADIQMDYFKLNSKEMLVAAFKICIKQHKNISFANKPARALTANDLRPFRMLISFLDKPEVGTAILEHVFLDILMFMHYLCQFAEKQSKNSGKGRSMSEEDVIGTQEIVKTANLLFGSLEPFYIWDFLARTFERVCEDDENSLDIPTTDLCHLIDFLLDKVSLESYVEIQTEHLPSLLHQIIKSTTHKCPSLTDNEACIVLKLCSKILSQVQPSMLPAGGSAATSPLATPSKKKPRRDDGDHRERVFSDSEESFLSADSDLNAQSGINDEGEGNIVKEDVEKGEKCIDSGEVNDEILDDQPDNVQLVNGDIIDIEQDSIEDNENDIVNAQLKKSLLMNDRKSDSLSKDIMQACAQSFRDLFYALMSERIIKLTVKDTSSLITRLYRYRFSSQSSQDFEEDNTFQDDINVYSNCDKNKDFDKVKLGNLSTEIIQAFTSGCRLLSDFSSFPLYCWNSEKILKDSFTKGFAPGLPCWLQMLIACSCYIDNFSVQSTAIATMLDLIGLTKSVETAAGSRKDNINAEGKVSVVIIPPITPKQLSFLETKTTFYEVVCERVWEHLGPSHYEWHQRSVELLYQLHQLTPDPWLCENIIGQTLTSPDKTEKLLGFHRFTVLWHLLRSSHEAPPQRKNLRTFDRSVLVMLESLQSDTHPCRSITHTWLSQALQRGDIMRLLEPMLWILLHPDTARVSIQHVKVEKPRRVRMYSESESETESVTEVEAKIYAISSEGGNVIYHVSNDQQGNKKHPTKLNPHNPKNLQGKIHSGAVGKSKTDGPSMAITSMTNKGGSATEKAGQNLHGSEMHFEKVNPNEVTLTMNPFTSQSSFDKVYEDFVVPKSDHSILEKAHRLDTETCRKEGLFFDEDVDAMSVDSDGGIISPGEPIDDNDSEEVIKSILEELIERAVVTSELNEPVRIRLSSIQSRESLNLCTEDLLNAIDSKMSEIDSQSEIDGQDPFFDRKKPTPIVHPLHTHILLYTQKYDTGRTIYALTCLKALLRAKPRLFTCAVSTTSLGSSYSVQVTRLLGLLVRHRRAVFGKNFYSEVTGENVGALKGGMMVDTLICVLLYFIRSYYPNFLMASLTEQQLEENKQVQILACEVLGLLLSELINVTRDSGRGFATYISDLLGRCKLQKTMLHCTLASVYNARLRDDLSDAVTMRNVPFTEVILNFNRQCMDFNTNDSTFQVKLLRILILIILLEDRIRKSRSEADSLLPPEWETSRVSFQPSLSSVRYVQSSPLIYQTMFLSAIISALKQQHLCSMHQHWLDLLTSILPYLGRALSHTVVCVVLQLCKNLELLAGYYLHGRSQEKDGPADVPPDHLLCLLEGLTTLVHYCLLDSAQQDIWVAQHLPSSTSPASDNSSPTHILSNIINVFRPYGISRESSPDKEVSTTISPVLEARRKLLSNLPRILACVSTLWQAVENSQCHTVWTLGTPKMIRQYMIEFLSPIACNHGVNLLGAVAVVWNDRRQKGLPRTLSVIPGVSQGQSLLVDVLSAIKVLPQDTLIQTVTQVIKQPPPTTHDRSQKRTPLEVNLLQFFYTYVQRQPGSQLVESWSPLLNLLKEGSQLNMPPTGQFLLLAILNEFVQKTPMFDDKTDQKSLQEICQKLLEACSEIAGAQLEQKSLLSRSLVVKPGSQVDIEDAEDALLDSPASDISGYSGKSLSKQNLAAVGNVNRHYSVHALVLLGELTATLLDMVYKSEEKEKVVPFLMSVMLSVFPYLKNHSVHNLPSLRGCSQLLASLSSYQYTRKAWKKEAFDLLLDQPFFQMDAVCLAHWKVIIDNLMTNDRTTFKDLLAKVIVAPSASLNLFTSKEHEWEQRCQLLKRLTFVLFCSDVDQYQRAMPDIQERLSDSLRPPLIPVVQAQVFYCFRVLLLRMSQHNITSLWPSISTELVQVLLLLEQELAPDPSVKGQYSHFIDLPSGNNGVTGGGVQGHPGWLRLYLAACKLLDMVLCLPTHLLPQFQLYKWAFVGDMPEDDAYKSRRTKEQQLFFPHVVRIARHMRQRFGDSKILEGYGQPLLTMRSIKSVKDLHPFFTTLGWGLSTAVSTPIQSLMNANSMSKSKSAPEGFHQRRKDLNLPLLNAANDSGERQLNKDEEAYVLNYVENMVLNDFLDPMGTK